MQRSKILDDCLICLLLVHRNVFFIFNYYILALHSFLRRYWTMRLFRRSGCSGSTGRVDVVAFTFGYSWLGDRRFVESNVGFVQGVNQVMTQLNMVFRIEVVEPMLPIVCLSVVFTTVIFRRTFAFRLFRWFFRMLAGRCLWSIGVVFGLLGAIDVLFHFEKTIFKSKTVRNLQVSKHYLPAWPCFVWFHSEWTVFNTKIFIGLRQEVGNHSE